FEVFHCGGLNQTCQRCRNSESITCKPIPYHSIVRYTGHQASPERLEEFRRIYKEVYGEEITIAEASIMTHQLLTLYRLLSQPLPGRDATPTPSPPPPAPTASEEL